MRMTVLRVRMTDYALSMHMASKHKLKLNTEKDTDEEEYWIPLEEDDYKCGHCDTEFDTISALNAHLTWRELVDPHACEHSIVCRYVRLSYVRKTVVRLSYACLTCFFAGSAP